MYKIPFAELEELLENDDYEGVCINCGYIQDSCEPDACKYECEECNKPTVYGAQEILLRGWYAE